MGKASRKALYIILAVALFLIPLAAAGEASQIYVATQAVGTSYYALGAGIAMIISENTPYSATVLPYSGADAFMPDIKDGVVNAAMIAVMDLVWAYTGTVNYDETHEELRLLASGNWSNHCTMTVLAGSGITSITDLRGKRVGYEYGGNQLTVLLVDAALESVGMTIDDCEIIPIADLNAGLRALQERRVDCVFSGANTSPGSMQLDEAVGLLILPIGNLTPEELEANGVPASLQATYDRLVPGATAVVTPPGGTVKVPTVLTAYPIQMTVTTALSEDEVYSIMKAIYENHAELADAHVWGRGWTPENYVVADFMVPYHDGAVKFYKEVGLWTDAAEATQQALLM